MIVVLIDSEELLSLLSSKYVIIISMNLQCQKTVRGVHHNVFRWSEVVNSPCL